MTLQPGNTRSAQHVLINDMWFLPRVSAIGVLAILVGVFLLFASGLEEIAYVLSCIVAVVLLIGIIFDRYEGPKK
jgi:hypothetical protein